MKFRFFRNLLVVFCSLFFNVQIALSVEVENLYQVKVGVEDQSSKNRWNAVVTGFKEVMVRRSGSEEVLSSREVQKVYSKVTAYLQRSKYEQVSDSEAEFPLNIVIDFEPRLIDQLIQEAGMPIWGSNRPLSLLWLAIEENFSRKVIKESEEFAEVINAINEQTVRRGIPVIFPLMDLEDQLTVTQSDIWGLFTGPVVEASQRYAADSVLAGRIRQIGESWEAKLVYVNQGEEIRIELVETSKENLFAMMANRLAEVLCEKYCVVEQVQTDQLVMQVSNINSFADIKSLQNYLDGLSSIRKIEVNQVSGNAVRFKVGLLGDLASLQEDIRLGQKLIEETAPNIDPFSKVDTTEDAELESELGESDELQNNVSEDAIEISKLNMESLESKIESEENLKNEESLQQQTSVIYYRWQG